MAGVTSYYHFPRKTMEVNILGLFRLLINFSTSEVYGPYVFRSAEDEMTAQGAAGDYRWSYAVSKLAGEHLLFAHAREGDLPFVTVRPFNIYGPGQVGEGAVSLFIDRALKNEPILVTGDGTQIRATTIHDLVRAIVRKCGSRSEIRFVKHQGTDVELRVPNIHKAAELLGFQPRVDLEEGLERTIAWHRAANPVIREV